MAEFESFPQEEQTIEGVIGDNPRDFSCLPESVKPEMVDCYLDKEGKWCWHLKPEYIHDRKKAEEYREVRNQWP